MFTIVLLFVKIPSKQTFNLRVGGLKVQVSV